MFLCSSQAEVISVSHAFTYGAMFGSVRRPWRTLTNATWKWAIHNARLKGSPEKKQPLRVTSLINVHWRKGRILVFLGCSSQFAVRWAALLLAWIFRLSLFGFPSDFLLTCNKWFHQAFLLGDLQHREKIRESPRMAPSWAPRAALWALWARAPGADWEPKGGGWSARRHATSTGSNPRNAEGCPGGVQI